MPCGGIYPYGPLNERGPGTIEEELDPRRGGCWVCNHGGCAHFCDEWDTYIHAACALTFLLASSSGEVVIGHKHDVHLDFNLEHYGQVTAQEYAKKIARKMLFGRG